MSKYAPMKNTKSIRFASDRNQELEASRSATRSKKQQRAELRAAKRQIIE